jgi:DNA modification methylase
LITGTITKEKPGQKLIELIKAMRSYLGECSMMAYLSMMAPRLVETKRILKDTGTIYLHCDPTSSHYLKLLMDAIFGVDSFQTEIIWKRSSAHSDAKQGRNQHGHIHDVILFYSKTHHWIWNQVYTEYDESYIANFYRYVEKSTGRRYRIDNLTAAKPGGDTSYEWRVKRRKEKNVPWEADLTEEYKKPTDGWEYKGVLPYKRRYWAYSKANMIEYARENRIYHSNTGVPCYKRYFDEMPGVPLQDIWTDINPALATERLGYPTQKPEALLERIIKASSNEGDLVLDPFCGCGTTIAVAQSLKRKWIGIDITYLAIDVIKKRLEKNRVQEGVEFEIDGEPTDVYSAEKLAEKDPFQFQIWCVSKLDTTPSETKIGDQGIDGIINFIDLTKKDKAGKGIIQVKGTQTVNPAMVRDLKGTMKSQNADFGILITLKKPTQGMITEAVKNGYAESTKKIPKIQLLTVEDLFKRPIPIVLPGQILPPYKKPELKKQQGKLF